MTFQEFQKIVRTVERPPTYQVFARERHAYGMTGQRVVMFTVEVWDAKERFKFSLELTSEEIARIEVPSKQDIYVRMHTANLIHSVQASATIYARDRRGMK